MSIKVHHIQQIPEITSPFYVESTPGTCPTLAPVPCSYAPAAVESVKQNPPCDIILAAVISNPSEETVRLVEEDAATHHFA